MLIVISAPSGAGKSTLINKVLQHAEFNLEFSISATSRAPRGAERHGHEYYFLSADDFRNRIGRGEFVEYEEVYPNCFYGTLRSEVERITAQGKHVLFDVDVVGGTGIKALYGNDALSIFIAPPSVEALRQRLTGRGTDTAEMIEKRIAKSEYEMTFARNFDTIIVNDVLENAEKEIVGKINDFLLPCQQPETIGLYFGSFNPIHNGHLKLAKYITANRIADEVWFVVSPCNPLKQQDELLDETLRMEMVKLATETEDTLKACDVELSLPTPSYTIDTLNVLKKQYPNNNFVLLIGSDNALAFDRWKNYKEILNEYKIMVYPRLNYDFAEILQKFPQMQILDTPFYDISASKIREKIKKQDLEITKQWLQEPVSAFIEENKLYQ